MKIRNLLLALGILLGIMGIANADYGFVEIYNTSESFTIDVLNYNASSGTIIAGSTCTLNIYNDSFVVALSSATMQDQGNGYYNYTWSYGAVGIYRARICCIKNSAGGCVNQKIKLVDDDLEEKIDSMQGDVTEILTDTSDIETDLNDGVDIASAQTVAACTDVTNPVTCGTVSDKTGYSLTTQDWTTDSDLVNLSSDMNVSDIRGDIAGIDDNPWDDGARTLTSPIASDSNQNMTGLPADVSGLADNTTLTAVKAKTDNLPTDPADDSDIDDQLANIQTDLDNPSQFMVDISSLLTTAQFDLNLSQLFDYGDSAWATATGFSEHAASAIWAVATRALTTPIATDSSQNMTGIQLAGSMDSEQNDTLHAIETDTEAMDTSGELRTLLTGGDYAVATQDNISALDTLIDAIKAVTDRIDFDGSDWINVTVHLLKGDVITAASIATNAIGLDEFAYVVADNTTLTAVLEDTDEIQGNQSAFYPADVSGLSTHSAADVDNLIDDEAILANVTFTSQYKADVSALATSAEVDELNGSINVFKQELNYTIRVKIDELNASQRAYFVTQDNFTNINDFIHFPPTSAVISIDFSKSGMQNLSVFDNVEPQFFFGYLTPSNSENTRTNFYQKVFLTMTSYPENITDAWLPIWLSYTGSPTTDNLEIFVNGDSIVNLTTGDLTTSLVQYMIKLPNVDMLTGPFIAVDIVGNADHSVNNEFNIGYGGAASLYSYANADNTTWDATTQTDNENALGMWIQYNQKSIASEVNAETIVMEVHTPKPFCPGYVTQWAVTFKSYTLQGFNVTLPDACFLYEIDSNGTFISIAANESLSKATESSVIVTYNATQTSILDYGKYYASLCYNMTVFHENIDNHTLEVRGVQLRTYTEAQCKFLNDTLQGNFSQVLTVIATAQTDLDNPSQYQADLTALELEATAAGRDLNATARLSELNATMHEINDTLTAVNASLFTHISNSIAGLANVTLGDIWTYGTRTMTGFSFAVNVTSQAAADIYDYFTAGTREDEFKGGLDADQNKTLYDIQGNITDIPAGGLTTGQNATLYLTSVRVVNISSALDTIQNYWNCTPNWSVNSVCERLEWIERAV